MKKNIFTITVLLFILIIAPIQVQASVELPVYNDVSIITGVHTTIATTTVENWLYDDLTDPATYTWYMATSTNTTVSTSYDVYHVPIFFVFIILLVFIPIISRLIIEAVIIFRR